MVSQMSQGILVSDHLGYNLWKGKCPPKPIRDTCLPVATLLLEISGLDSSCFNAGQDSTARLWVGGFSVCVVVVVVMVCKLYCRYVCRELQGPGVAIASKNAYNMASTPRCAWQARELPQI